MSVALGVPGCAWHVGEGPALALTFGAPAGATAQAGLAQDLREALVREVVRRGGEAKGAYAEVRIDRASTEPTAATEGIAAAWTAWLAVTVEVPARRGCRSSAQARRMFLLEPGDSLGYASRRQEAFHDLVAEVAVLAIDGLSGVAACR